VRGRPWGKIREAGKDRAGNDELRWVQREDEVGRGWRGRGRKGGYG